MIEKGNTTCILQKNVFILIGYEYDSPNSENSTTTYNSINFPLKDFLWIFKMFILFIIDDIKRNLRKI